MNKRPIQLPPPTGVVGGSAAGTILTFDLPLGYRYHDIHLVYVDGSSSGWLDIGALLADIILYRNGIPERTHTSLELDHLNGINGSQYQKSATATAAAGSGSRQTQTIFFNEPWRKQTTVADGLAWSVNAANGFTQFQLKCTLLAAMPATGAIYAWARVDAPLAPPKGGQPVKKVYRQQIPASGTSNDITTLDQRDAYQVIALKHPTGTYITDAIIKNNGAIIYDKVNIFDNVAELTQLGMNPAASTAAGAFGFDIILDADDPINSAVPPTGESGLWLHLDYNAAASGNVVALIERLGTLD